jgi:LmbE family N-acetylglucosaminyl deacetylase
MARHEEVTPEAEKRRSERRENARRAADVLGVRSVEVLDYWGNHLDDVALIDIVRDVSATVEAFEPDVIYTHHCGDLNVDHERAARAVRTAARPLADSPVDRILSFETLSATEWSMPRQENAFRPTVFVDVSDTIDRKMDAIEVYREEMCERPHPRSVENVRRNARTWGDKSGFPVAEPFELVLERRGTDPSPDRLAG